MFSSWLFWCVNSVLSILAIGFVVAEHLKPVDVKIAQLGEALESVSAEIRYLQSRDLRHRKSKYLLSFKPGTKLCERNEAQVFLLIFLCIR